MAPCFEFKDGMSGYNSKWSPFLSLVDAHLAVDRNNINTKTNQFSQWQHKEQDESIGGTLKGFLQELWIFRRDIH